MRSRPAIVLALVLSGVAAGQDRGNDGKKDCGVEEDKGDPTNFLDDGMLCTCCGWSWKFLGGDPPPHSKDCPSQQEPATPPPRPSDTPSIPRPGDPSPSPGFIGPPAPPPAAPTGETRQPSRKPGIFRTIFEMFGGRSASGPGAASGSLPGDLHDWSGSIQPAPEFVGPPLTVGDGRLHDSYRFPASFPGDDSMASGIPPRDSDGGLMRRLEEVFPEVEPDSSPVPSPSEGRTINPATFVFPSERPSLRPAGEGDMRPYASPSSSPVVGPLPTDGTVQTLRGPGRSYGPDQPLVSVVGGIFNSTESNAHAAGIVGDLVPEIGVSWVNNVQPGDDSPSVLQRGQDIRKAEGTRFPGEITVEQASEIAKEVLSDESAWNVTSPRPDWLPDAPVPVSILRERAQIEGKTAEIEAAIEKAVERNQIELNPAITALQKIQEGKIRQGQDHYTIAHSEGEIIASIATKITIRNIMEDPALSPPEKDRALRHIRIRSFGGAGDTALIDSIGPKIGSFDRYRHPDDPVSRIVPDAATPFQTLLQARPDDLSGLSDHGFRGYMMHVYLQGEGYLLQDHVPPGTVRTIVIP